MRNLYTGVENAAEAYRVQQEALANADERLSFQRQRLDSGLIPDVQFKQAELENAQTALQTLSARHAYLNALLELQSGTLLELSGPEVLGVDDEGGAEATPERKRFKGRRLKRTPERQEMPRAVTRPLFIRLLAPLLVFTLAACSPDEPQADVQTENETQAQVAETFRPVRTVPAERGTLDAVRSTSVTIEPQQESRVAAGASGRVERIAKREGARVEAGEVVIELDDQNARLALRNAELALEAARINLSSAERASGESSGQSQAQVRTARTNFELAQRQYEEGRALLEAGGLSSTELSQLEAQLSQAQAALVQAEDAVSRSGRAGSEDLALLRVQVQQAQTSLEQAQRALDDTRITAPFSGELAEVFVEEGEFIGAGSPAFRLASLENKLARFRVPPEDAARLPPGTDITIQYAGNTYPATVQRSSGVSGDQRLVELTAEIAPTDTPIPSGSVASLRYNIELGTGILVPSNAVNAEAGRSYVSSLQPTVSPSAARSRSWPSRDNKSF